MMKNLLVSAIMVCVLFSLASPSLAMHNPLLWSVGQAVKTGLVMGCKSFVSGSKKGSRALRGTVSSMNAKKKRLREHGKILNTRNADAHRIDTSSLQD